jgi:hypothetical protein
VIVISPAGTIEAITVAEWSTTSWCRRVRFRRRVCGSRSFGEARLAVPFDEMLTYPLGE